MLVIFTPFTFFFFLIYLGLISFIFCISDFYEFWVLMECSAFVFMGMCFSCMATGFSSIMVYFIIQALASLNIFIFYLLGIDLGLCFFLFLKLAVFPFCLWYYSVMLKLPNFIFVVSSTFHKLPSFYVFFMFISSYELYFVWICIVGTVMFGALSMVGLLDFRSLMIFSSVGNNGWFLLASMVSVDIFFLYFLFYSMNFFMLIYTLGGVSLRLFSFNSIIMFFFLLISMAGFPLFPIFFMKLFLVSVLIGSSSLMVGGLILVLLFTMLMMLSYARFLFFVITNRFGLGSFLYL